jgi:hypothetical protein
MMLVLGMAPGWWTRAALVLTTLLAAGCTSPGTTAGVPAGPADSASPHSASRTRVLAAQYMAIARPANHRLDDAVDGFEEHSRDDLAKALEDLREQAAIEQRFDRLLARIPFPPGTAAIAASLIRANQARIQLTLLEAKADSLAQLRSFEASHRSADAAVEIQVRAIRDVLGLPPPPDSS